MILSKWVLVQNQDLGIKTYCKHVNDANNHYITK